MLEDRFKDRVYIPMAGDVYRRIEYEPGLTWTVALQKMHVHGEPELVFSAAPAQPAEPLKRDVEASNRLANFHESGLLWLVNAAILHPRGFALALHADDAGDPISLSVVGEGDEPWCFTEDQYGTADVLKFARAELKREQAWGAKLRIG